jgi:hypothetical protein
VWLHTVVRSAYILCLTLSLTDCAYRILFFGATTLLGHSRHYVQVSRWHTGIPHSVEPLWTRDRPVAETSTWHHTTLTRDRQTSVPPVRFKPATTPSERPQTDALDRLATRIGTRLNDSILTNNMLLVSEGLKKYLAPRTFQNVKTSPCVLTLPYTVTRGALRPSASTFKWSFVTGSQSLDFWIPDLRANSS